VNVGRNVVQRYARLTTDVVVAKPGLWRVLRAPLRIQFGRLARRWDEISSPARLAPLERALDSLDRPPTRVLDLGTGTGNAALMLVRRYPRASVTGVDLAPEMIARARAKIPADAADRLTFEVADAARLPFDDGFDLVVLANMIPFFDELVRVTAPDGAIALNFSRGAETPIYVAPERVHAELAARGFTDFADFRVGEGIAVLARRIAES
jgi:ubiquinone/menaquinone biosynthesis C-methylase UbiE